jgi:hypothetical protein
LKTAFTSGFILAIDLGKYKSVACMGVSNWNVGGKAGGIAAG